MRLTCLTNVRLFELTARPNGDGVGPTVWLLSLCGQAGLQAFDQGWHTRSRDVVGLVQVVAWRLEVRPGTGAQPCPRCRDAFVFQRSTKSHLEEGPIKWLAAGLAILLCSVLCNCLHCTYGVVFGRRATNQEGGSEGGYILSPKYLSRLGRKATGTSASVFLQRWPAAPTHPPDLCHRPVRALQTGQSYGRLNACAYSCVID